VLGELYGRHIGEFDGDACDGLFVQQLDRGTMQRHHCAYLRIRGEQLHSNERDGAVHYKYLFADGESRRDPRWNRYEQLGKPPERHDQLRASCGNRGLRGECDV
jgi:hypothetical protein